VSDDVVTVERVIPAQPERIFALLKDASRHKDFDGSGTVRDAHGDPEPLTLGAKFGMHMRLGISYSMVSTVVEYDENKRIAWQPRPSYPIANRLAGGRIWRYELEAVDGGTLVRESWDITQEAPLTKPAVRMAGARTRTAMEKTLERLEQLLSAEAPAR